MKSFAFNLLPEKAPEQIKKEVRKELGVVIASVLPLVGVLLWLALLLFNALVLEEALKTQKAEITTKNLRIINEYSSVLNDHGELVTKTRALKDVVTKDISPERVFALTEELFPKEESNITIMAYGRSNDGTYNVTIKTDSYLNFAKVARRFSGSNVLEDVHILSVANQEGRILGTVKFSFLEPIKNG
jgi:hypothetical protein